MICDRCDQDAPVIDRWVRQRQLTMDLCPACSEREFGIRRRALEFLAGNGYAHIGHDVQITRVRAKVALRLV